MTKGQRHKTPQVPEDPLDNHYANQNINDWALDNLLLAVLMLAYSFWHFRAAYGFLYVEAARDFGGVSRHHE